METNSIIKYLRKEIEKYTYEDDRYIEYSVKINYINRLIDKIKKG